jgi:hypothetical protein
MNQKLLNCFRSCIPFLLSHFHLFSFSSRIFKNSRLKKQEWEWGTAPLLMLDPPMNVEKSHQLCKISHVMVVFLDPSKRGQSDVLTLDESVRINIEHCTIDMT